MRHHLWQPYAVDRAGRAVHAAEVLRGLACECTCPACGAAMIARQGDVRVPHFAHAAGAGCPHGAESGLHLAAKQLIAQHRGLMLPEVRPHGTLEHASGIRGHSERRLPNAWVDFDTVLVETGLDGRWRPDVVGIDGSWRIAIEIRVTHGVEEAKRAHYARARLPAVEIDLTSLHGAELAPDALRKAVIEDAKHKRWIHSNEWDLLRAAGQRDLDDFVSEQLAIVEQSLQRDGVRQFRLPMFCVVVERLPVTDALFVRISAGYFSRWNAEAFYCLMATVGACERRGLNTPREWVVPAAAAQQVVNAFIESRLNEDTSAMQRWADCIVQARHGRPVDKRVANAACT